MPLLVNNEPIEDDLIRAEIAAIRPRLHEAMEGEDPRTIEARAKEWARENVIERVLLRQEALARQQDVDALLGSITAHVSRPRNKDVSAFYLKNREKLVAPERVHAAHIIKQIDETHSEAEARAAIEEIEVQLEAGAVFEQLADSNSDCPGRGGDLGVFPRGAMVPEFENVVFALEPGARSGIFQTAFGFHIAKVYEKLPAGIPRLEHVRAEIEEELFNQKRQKAVEQFLDHLRAKATVDVS